MGIRGPGNGSTPTEVPHDPRPAVMLTSYLTDAPHGRNLTALGYSYDFVGHAFTPLLERWGHVIAVRSPEKQLESEIVTHDSWPGTRIAEYRIPVMDGLSQITDREAIIKGF